ncbi:MAG TPA: hypothetical protein VMV53_05500 [Acidimicrobiales bacterium]|nr:hypothetical protein [Acidimicrobiales bacterium]
MTKRPRVLAALEGYAVEGGIDGPRDPATCYRATIALGRHEGPGAGDELWRDYEQVLALVPSLGLDGVRLGVEWARVEPHRGVVDDAALERYARAVSFARSLDLHVSVVVVDNAWPSWLGLEAWLLPWVVPHVLAQARRLVQRFGNDLGALVPFADAAGLAERGFVRATAPPWRARATADADSARRQLDLIIGALASDELVGPRLVASARTLDVDADARLLADVLAERQPVEEIHLRSLVRGRGPSAARAGLLERREGVWQRSSAGELLKVLG